MFSKCIDDVGGNGSTHDNYNLAADKSVDGSDVPHSFVLSYFYGICTSITKASFSRTSQCELRMATSALWRLPHSTSSKPPCAAGRLKPSATSRENTKAPVINA